MLTRTKPLISPFPDFTIIEHYSSKYLSLPSYKPLFYDIETTGLSSASAYCYLIGCTAFENGHWYLHQWLAENPEEEEAVLKEFSDYARNFTYTIQYNGNKFDQPFLSARADLYKLEMPVLALPSLDLFHLLKPCKKMLKLEHMKQPDLEAFLHVPSRIFADGRLCIKCYKEYQKKRDSDALNEVFGHNTEDLCGLGSVFEMLHYLQIFSGEYDIQRSVLLDNGQLMMETNVLYDFPSAFSYGCDGLYLTASKKDMKLLINTCNQKCRMYYPNYKDYVYLPQEDTVIPKSLGNCIDKSLKKPAKPETCYTWFEVNETFLNDRQMQKKFLDHLLRFILCHKNS